jgi:hypothetical protein
MESVYGNTLDVFGKTLLDLARFEVGQGVKTPTIPHPWVCLP